MATYEIENYIKLICIRIDHFESFIVSELNTNSAEEIERFMDRYSNREGLKVIIVKMNSMETITFDEVKKIIKTAHVFDYIRMLNNEGHQMLDTDTSIPGIGAIIKHLINTY